MDDHDALRLTLDIAAAHTTGRLLAPHSRELLDRTLIWNQAHLRRILSQYETHHNQHRPHRCLHAAAAQTATRTGRP